ncbi:MAG: 23S rRNA (adenine(2503)-C(2))-methyltransferase RlmN [Mogibacterium sp.]|nr:23S rRNA (adenine(2503)-C(2))-methyltransferase RlmN [Mogibacterium sp.]
MSNLPTSLIEKLEESYYIGLPKIARSQKSKDGTVKCLFGFRSGESSSSNNVEGAGTREREADTLDLDTATDTYTETETITNANANASSYVESVFMKYSYGNSICISSQVGCRMGCTFCASTMNGLERNLTGGEMLAEVLAMRNHTREDIGHIVVMGMGEPFDNYDELSKFINLIHDPKGYNLGLRNITVSTCGIIPMIRRFAEDFPQVNLAVSLHAPNQEMREQTMPVAKKYRYDELMQVCREYTEKTSRRITFEYALIDGVNDSEDCAKELADNLRGMLAHVNLIPLNEVKGREYRQACADNVKRFRQILEKRGIAVTIRRTLGSDIDAACGQLRNRDK